MNDLLVNPPARRKALACIAGLKVGGITIPDPDYWIAAHAIEERLPLTTTDRHFEFIPELNVHFVEN